LFTKYSWIKRINQKIVFHKTFAFLLVAGAAIASFDQLILSAITPFVIVSVAAPLVLSLSPFITLFWYLISFFVFVFLAPVFQPNHQILDSVIVNAFTIVLTGFFLNLAMWHNTLSRMRQLQLIQLQQNQLQLKNSELTQMTKELKFSNNLKDKLFSIIAHDLRNPFNVLISSSEMLLDEASDYTKEEQDILKSNIRKTAKNTYLLLQNLLEWSQVQRNKVQLSLKQTNLDQLIHDSTIDFNVSLKEKNIGFIKELNAISVLIDPVLITSVIRNLVSNAIKFTPRNGRIRLETAITEHQLTIKVNDNGTGMPPEMVQNLFNETQATSRQGTEGEKSTGLGLQLCKEFVELHQGQIIVESEENIGSTFTVILPLPE
jgi:signal transduction histidine kinase